MLKLPPSLQVIYWLTMKVKAISARQALGRKQLKQERKRLKKIPLVQHLIKRFDSPVAIYEAQMVEQGLISKEFIENAYDHFQVSYFEIWNNLSFDQKSVFINREMNDLFSRLRYATLDSGTRIYLPFFDERFNRFYRDSIAVMDLPHFRKQFADFFHHCVRPSHYGPVIYTGDFTQARLFTTDNKQNYYLVDTINELIIQIQHQRPTKFFSVSKKDVILYNEEAMNEFMALMNKENI